MSLSMRLLGGKRIRATREHRVAVLNVCLQNGIPYSDFCWHDDGSVSFLVPLSAVRRLTRACRAANAEWESVGAYGLPAFAWRMRRRIGLVLGGVLAVILLCLSGRFVWSVDVVGNERLSDEEVREILRACDFGVGTYIPSVQVRALENRVLIASDEIAWVSVYLDGTVARVQVIERDDAPKPIAPSADPAKPANLVAAYDGQIELVMLYRGEAVVTIGQAVRKGELLVSGIYSSPSTGFRYTRAAGEILARTEHTYRVEIPLSYEEKVYGERKMRSATLNFFDFPLKIFKNTGNVNGNCDIMKEDTEFTVFGGRTLPLTVTRTYTCPYTLQTRTRTADAALELAYAELDGTLTELSSSAELLGKRLTTEITATAVVLTCTVTCIENIAVSSEFEIRETD